jgi:signal-transduction protein with cAMP-binding, CBS, and nucleotidyltransferase domain
MNHPPRAAADEREAPAAALLDPAERHVADAMVRCPNVHGPSTTVGQLRTFFRDDHVHMALLVDAGELLAAVVRADLSARISDETLARSVGTVNGRTIRPEAPAFGTLKQMKRAGVRRLAVTNEEGVLLGLLCLNASGRGFCSDEDVNSRKRAFGVVHEEASEVVEPHSELPVRLTMRVSG